MNDKEEKKELSEYLDKLQQESDNTPHDLESTKAAILKHDNLPEDFDLTVEWLENRIKQCVDDSYYWIKGSYKSIPGQPNCFHIPSAMRHYTEFESWLEGVLVRIRPIAQI